MAANDLDFLAGDAVRVARRLIGWRLYVREADGSLTGGVITETEAYSQDDAASHSYRGKTARTEVMFGSAGRVYVYFTYGMHWCMNIVVGAEGRGEAVLIRAITPDSGIEHMRRRRKNATDANLANGPAKLCQALAVDGADNGAEIGAGKFQLLPPSQGARYPVTATERIGIKQDTHRLWRFVASNP